MEILGYLGDTYWSSDYLVEINGYKKIAKFVDKKLIHNRAEVILRSDLARSISGILVPEDFYFEERERDIFVYDISSYKTINQITQEHVQIIVPQLFSILKTVLHIPKLYIPYIGLDDIIVADDEVRIFLPLIQSLESVHQMSERWKIFIAPEFYKGESSDKSTIYVFGKLIYELIDNSEVKKVVEPMIVEDVSKREFTEEIPFHNVLPSKKILTVRRIVRDEEKELIDFISNPGKQENFIGVIGPQRVGKTTTIENLQNYFRQSGIPFLHVMNASDLIAQTLQISSERIPDSLLTRLTYCLENVCSIDTISVDVVEALSYLDKVIIFVDDYHEASELLRAFLRRIATLETSGKIKILAFSVEDSEDFEVRFELKPFTKDMIRRLLNESFSKVENEDILVDWLYGASGGLPGLIVENLRYLYENEILTKVQDQFVCDVERLVELNIETAFVDRIRKYEHASTKYLAILGQKFTLDEVKHLEEFLGIEISLQELFEDGILYREYSKIRFTLRHYWQILHEAIPVDERLELHKRLSAITTDFEKKAWHLELSGNKISAAVAYLKYANEMLNYYASPSVIHSILQKAKRLIYSRESYAFLKLTLELFERTEDKTYAEDIEIPDKNIYTYLKARYYYLLYDYDQAIEILKNSKIDLGPFGNLRREFLLMSSEVAQSSKRNEYYERVKQILENLDETNPVHVRLIVDIYIFISFIARSNSSRVIEYLRKAEKLALDYNIAHKLPSIYNNLALGVTNTTISMEYLQRAVEVAERIGLPARSYLARLNMLSHALYAGRIKDFLVGMAELMPKLEMLGLRDEIIFANTIEAFYHSYNFELENALEHLESVGKRFGVDMSADVFSAYFLSRNLDKAKEIIPKVLESEQFGEDTKEIIRVISSLESGEFPEKWKRYRDSGGKYFREEMAAVLGEELAKSVPDTFKEELEYLETNYVLDGSLLSLAMVYEGYGHYYKVLGNEYKSRSYYSKALTLYKDIGMENAAKSLSRIYNIESEESEKRVSSKQLIALSYDLLSSLKAIDPKTEPERLLNFFSAKILSVIPARTILLKVYDSVLDKAFETAIGVSEGEKPSKETFSTIPLEIYLVDNVDQSASYELWLSNPKARFSEDYKKELLPILQLLEYSFIAVMKGTLTWLRSLIDPLTKLYTRYHFSELLEHHFNKAVSENGELCVVMCDIDNFKNINDTYGHLTGDEVLKEVARILRDNVRSTDVVARFGGEEFVLLFPSTGREEALIVVERLRRLTRDITKFPFKITLSYGVAVYPLCKVNNPEELIQKADVALYHAKNTGKDKIVLYSEGMTGGLHA